MADLWTPEYRPPQISEEAKAVVAERILAEGVVPVSRYALNTLETQQEALGVYFDRFGFELNQISEGFWPERVLKIGASLALLGYQEAGYTNVVSGDTVALSLVLAELEGIPDTYFSCAYSDPGMWTLMDVVKDAKDFVAPNPEGYGQVLDIGAGCVRFYLRNALEAA